MRSQEFLKGIFHLFIFASLAVMSACGGSENNAISRAESLDLRDTLPPQTNDLTIYLITRIEDDGSLHGIFFTSYIPNPQYQKSIGEGFRLQAGNQIMTLTKDDSVLDTGT